MSLIRGLAAACISLYGLLVILLGSMLVNLDNKGTNEVSIQGWHEWLAIAYVLFVGILLIFCAYRLFRGNNKDVKHAAWLSLLVLVTHGIYFLYGASEEAVPYLVMFHVPLVIGLSLSVVLIVINAEKR